MNILVTGSNGFLGKNLIKNLESNNDFNIFKFTRESSNKELIECIKNSDFIFHFAGEVRPNSNNKEFKLSNVVLTENIVAALEKENKKTPILYSSSIHAESSCNQYGKTKRDSEKLIEKYSNKYQVDCYIYRLPHLFGECAKPNHNSVLTTWIFNSINELEINVYDRNIKMRYVYVQDLINEFICCIGANVNDTIYIYPKIIHNTSLGEVVDYINEFKDNLNNKNYRVDYNTLKGKMYRVYMHYYNFKVIENNDKKYIQR